MSASDISLVVSNILGKKVLDAIPFPIEMDISPTLAIAAGGELGDASIQAEQEDTQYPEVYALSAEFEKHILYVAEQAKNGTIDVSKEPPDEVAAVNVLAKRIFDGAQNIQKLYAAAEDDELRAALSKIIISSALKVSIQWIRLELEKPQLTLANPIVLGNMVAKVQAQIRACLKVLGKEVCVTVTSPKVRIEGRQALLSLFGQGPKIFASPRLSDIDIVIKIKILKWSFKIRIGVTDLANKQLQKQGPILLMDLSTFEQKIPYSSKQLRVAGFDFSGGADGLNVNARIEIQ